MFQRFISFSQYHEPANPYAPNKLNNKQLNDETAQIKAEMMSFNVSFNQAISSNLNDLTRQILLKNRRTSEDIALLKNTFKNMPHMKQFNKLNPEMVNKVLRCCWLGEFEARRVIAAQYQLPQFFYIVLSGSLVCTYRTREERKSNTICLIDKGKCFKKSMS